jgi:glycosyltransferase involved in cell wall biosynthesis
MEHSVVRARIGLISDSGIANDPRVRRQGDALSAAGFDVVAVGQGSDVVRQPAWPIAAIGPMPELPSGLGRKLRRLADALVQRVRPRHVFDVYWRLNQRYRALYALARRQDVDLWIANDWNTLPIVLRLQRETGVPFGYDTHELAMDEYSQHLHWRLTTRPIIMGVEREGIAKAAFVSCVSEGIARRLQQAYALPAPPVLVRNTPPYQQSPLRKTGDKAGEQIRVLYHGVVSPGRALEECIASVAEWRPVFSLTIRGPADPAYLASLKRIAAEAGVADRVTFAPPVAMTELVAEARGFDVGLFAIKGHSRQNEHVLPNKFFEYAMAGLALCVSDLPEMRALIEEREMGALIAQAESKAIATAINSLNAARIDNFRANALLAARELSWEQEGQKMVSLVCDAIGSHRTQ